MVGSWLYEKVYNAGGGYWTAYIYDYTHSSQSWSASYPVGTCFSPKYVEGIMEAPTGTVGVVQIAQFNGKYSPSDFQYGEFQTCSSWRSCGYSWDMLYSSGTYQAVQMSQENGYINVEPFEVSCASFGTGYLVYCYQEVWQLPWYNYDCANNYVAC
jgi:hypothetical protein